MLRLDCRRSELRGLVPSEENYASRFFGVAFKHWSYRENSFYDYQAGRKTNRPARDRIITYEVRRKKSLSCFTMIKLLTNQVFQSPADSCSLPSFKTRMR